MIADRATTLLLQRVESHFTVNDWAMMLDVCNRCTIWVAPLNKSEFLSLTDIYVRSRQSCPLKAQWLLYVPPVWQQKILHSAQTVYLSCTHLRKKKVLTYWFL